jgi:hypothetical protein
MPEVDPSLTIGQPDTLPGQSEQVGAQNELVVIPDHRLGRLPLKTTRKALQFSAFFDQNFLQLPKKTNYWTRKKPLAQRTFGNTEYGDCTRAKQAYAAIRMERIEQKRTVDITDEEVIRVYVDMSNRLYGGGDNGAYEDDALSEWRKPELTFRMTDGNPHTIDAFLRINALNHSELKAGLALSGAKGLPFCINLPLGFSRIHRWDIPEGQALIGQWMPGSWGGHSMWAIDYDEEDMIVDDTWAEGPRRISWRAVAAYVDEAHFVIDSVDTWRKRAAQEPNSKKMRAALGNIADAVNGVSSQKIVLA